MLKSIVREILSDVQVVNVIDVENDSNVEDTAELFYLSDSTKLYNSDVLSDMDTKLRHLSESQRTDIKVPVQEWARPYRPKPGFLLAKVDQPKQ